MDGTYDILVKLLEEINMTDHSYMISVTLYYLIRHIVLLVVNIIFLFAFMKIFAYLNHTFNILKNVRELLNYLKYGEDAQKDKEKPLDIEKKKWKKMILKDGIDVKAIWDNFILAMKSEGAAQKLISVFILWTEFKWVLIMIKNIIENLICSIQCVVSPAKILTDYISELF